MMKMLWKSNQTAVKLHAEEKTKDLVVGMGHFEG